MCDIIRYYLYTSNIKTIWYCIIIWVNIISENVKNCAVFIFLSIKKKYVFFSIHFVYHCRRSHAHTYKCTFFLHSSNVIVSKGIIIVWCMRYLRRNISCSNVDCICERVLELRYVARKNDPNNVFLKIEGDVYHYDYFQILHFCCRWYCMLRLRSVC